jgi:adhesin HecA-like repeat protein
MDINNAGTLAANGGMALTTDALANSGTLVAGGDIALQAMALQNAGTIDAAGNLSLGELDVLANAGGTLRAGNNLSLALAAFDDRLVGGLLESWGTTTITAGQASFHERFMTPGSLLLQVGQLDIGADATVAAWGGTVVETDTLDNRGVLFGHAGLGINAASSVTNRENAVLLADGDLWVVGEGEQALPELVNRGGRIESTAGDLWLAAASIRNTNVGWDTRTTHWTEVDYQHGQTAFDTFYFSGEEWSENIHTWRRTTHGTDRDVVAQGTRGLILAAGDITLAGGDVTNNRSLVSAGGDLYVTGASLTNTGSVLTDERRILRVERWHTCEYDNGSKKCGNDHQIIDPPEEREGRTEYIASVLEAAGNVHIGTGVVVNGKRAIGTATTANPVRGRLPGDADGFAQGGIVDPTALPGFHLPESGLFRTAPPGAGYLVERNPDLASYEGFLGSQYLLDALDWSADITTQRLGDGWYELELLRDALLAATGSRFLAPDFNDEVAQFRHLMDNAIEAWEALELSPGIALSAEQVNRLNSDIVWLEPRRIGKQDVLVPVVYLAATRPALTPDGTVIAAGGDMFVDAGTLANSGTFRAADLLQVKTAGDLLNNGGTFSADTLVASAGRNLVNTSGLFSGHDVYLSATKDIRHITHSELLTAGAGNTTSYRVALGRTAGVQASGNLVQTAGDDMLLAGASLSGENIVLDAKGDLQVGTVALGEGLHAANDNWSLDRASWDYLATTIEAEVDAHLSAGEEMTLQAVQLSANTGDLSLFAGKDLAVLAATAGRSEQTWRREDKDYAEDITTTSAYDETLRRSNLSAGGDVLVNAVRDETGQLVALGDSKGDVTLQAVDIRQGGDAMVYAGKDLLVTAGVEQHYYHSETTRKYDGWVEDAAKGAGALLSATGNAMMPGYGIDYSFGLKGGSAEGNTRQHLVDSRFHGKGNTLLVAGEGVTLEAGRISGRDLYVSAGTNEGSDAGVTLAGLQTNDSRYREETTLVFGQTQGYGSLSTHAENTRSSREDNTRWHGTRVDMDGRVEIRSANDMFVQGADIRAGGDILLDAAGKMAIVAGESSRSASSNLASDANLGEYHNESDLHRSGTAEVSQFRSGGNITFESGGDQTHEGTLAKAAGGIALTSERGAVHLLAARDTEQTRHTEESSDFSWVTQKDSGRYDETLRMVSLQPRGQLIVDAAKGIDIDIERIDGKTGPALVNTLAARDPELAWLKDMADRGDIDWNRVQEVHESWSDEHEGLGAGASAVLAVAITAMTGGAGGAVWGGVSTTTAAGANAVAAATAATSAVVGAATTQVTLGTINNGGNLGEAISGLDRRESVEGLAISAFTAGTGSYVDALYTDMNFGKLPGEQIHSDAVRQLTYGFDLGSARGMAGFTLHHATMAGVEAGVQSLVAGDSFEGALKESLEQRGNDVVAALGFYQVGNLAGKLATSATGADLQDSIGLWDEGGLGKVGLHAFAGGAISEATGGDFRTGAAAAGFNQLTASMQADLTRDLSTSLPGSEQAWRGAGAEIAGVLGAALTGNDIAEGQRIGRLSEYNRQLHPLEFQFIENSPEVDAFARAKGISREEAETMLARNLMLRVDRDWALEKHIGEAFDVDAQMFLDELAMRGNRTNDGQLLFGRDYDTNPAAYENSLMFADGLESPRRYGMDSRTIFYVDHVVSDQVRQGYQEFGRGDFGAQWDAGSEALLGDKWNTVVDGIDWALRHPGETIASVTQGLVVRVNPGTAVAQAPADLRAAQDWVTNYLSADERASLSALHGDPFKAGYIATQDVIDNANVAVNVASLPAAAGASFGTRLTDDVIGLAGQKGATVILDDVIDAHKASAGAPGLLMGRYPSALNGSLISPATTAADADIPGPGFLDEMDWGGSFGVGYADGLGGDSTPSGVITGSANISERISLARTRQAALLYENVGYNISPTAWDQYPSIGRQDTYVTDRLGAMGYFGDIAGLSRVEISRDVAARIEMDAGLIPGSLQDGFKVRQIIGVQQMLPRSPMTGNQYFQGAGNHLPGGAPEMVIDSIPTIDNQAVKTLLEVIVR